MRIKKTGLFILAILAGALAAISGQAQDLEQKVRGLEQRLSQLKDEQLELKKQATEAAATLPRFKYDPGSGVRIEAADKAWALQLSHEIDWLMPFQSGKGHRDRTYMEVMGRRFRQEWSICINNCFYEVWSRLDLDGFGTNSGLQRAQAHLHFENVNPWLPTIYFGMDIVATGGQARQGSSATGAQAEYELLSRNNGFNTGGVGTGVAISYRSIDLGRVGIPGRARLNFLFGSVGGQQGDGLSRPTNKKDIATYFEISPFSQIKNKWINGFTFEIVSWFCNYDGHLERTTAASPALAISTAGPVTAARIDQVIRTQPDTEAAACNRLRIRDHGAGGRQTLFDSGLITGGLAHYVAPGIRWQIGPYNFRAYMGFNRYRDEDSLASQAVRVRFQESTSGTITQSTVTTNLGSVGKKSGRVWLIAHDLFLWSPTGFLTGDANTPGSVLVGTHFERTDVSCGNDGRAFSLPQNAVCNRITLNASTSKSEFTRNRLLVREWDLWYFIAPRASIGVNVLWYDASNLPSGFSSSSGLTNDVQKALGASGDCRNFARDITTNQASFGKSFAPPPARGAGGGTLFGFTGSRTGCGGSWTDVWLRLRWSF